VRLLHTSDWHLGHTLKDVTREVEHQAFLAWLLATCARELPDALIITGDVFDSATPPASAERMWFEFLAAARRQAPTMDIVAIAGNHDSPARLGAASAVLRELGVHVVGGLPRHALATGGDGSIDLDRVLVPIAGGRGLVAAVPFLRPIDLPADDPDPAATIYAEVIAGARARRTPGQALIVLGHLYIAGAEVSSLSERRVSIGGHESASMKLFPRDLDYVALGHMHRAQRVGGREAVRYAGAPIPLALDEAGYPHQVVIVDLGGGGDAAAIRSVRVPRAIEVVRVPARGAAPLADVLVALAGLEARRDGDDLARPYLEIAVALDRPEPKLRQLIEAALDGKRPRLIQLHALPTGDGAALGDASAAAAATGAGRLAELDPRDVFARCWARTYAAPPDAPVRDAFDRLLREVRGDLDDLEAS
jgi:exonuclease SbcD